MFLPKQSANVEETVKGERILEFFTCLALVLHLLGNHVCCGARVRLNWKQSRLKLECFRDGFLLPWLPKLTQGSLMCSRVVSTNLPLPDEGKVRDVSHCVAC